MLEQLRAYQQNYLNNLQVTYRRYFHQVVDFDNRLIGIVGARGVGKTTFLLQYLTSLELPFGKKLYLSADAIDLDSLFDIAYMFHQSGGEVLIVDEIHKYPNFEVELKKIYDMLTLKVIFSGSSALKIDNAKGDLSRRAIIYEMNGLSLREFIEIKEGISLNHYSFEELLPNHIDIAHELLSTIKPYQYWQEYLQHGFYPFYFENPKSYALRLKETINTVIEVDIPSLFAIDYDKIIALKKLIRLICQSKPFKINIKELSHKVGVHDYQTLYRYLEYLRRGKLINILKHQSKGDNIFLKPDKLYLANSNLHYAYCSDSEIGTIREAFFFSMFDDDRISFTKQGDFVIDGRYIFEIGGKNKSFKQIKDIQESFIVADDIEIGNGNKIPLWLFGFLY